MSQEVCVSVVEKCHRPLKQLTFFITGLSLVPKLLGLNSRISQITRKQQQDPMIADLVGNLKSDEVESTVALFKQANFVQLANRYERETSLRHTIDFNPHRLAQAERELCSQFIVLNNVPIIVQLTRIFTKEKETRFRTRDLLWQMQNSINKAQKVLRAKRIREHWRVLQFTTAAQSLGADVAIVSSNHDSSYSGVGVSGTHPMDFSNSP